MLRGRYAVHAAAHVRCAPASLAHQERAGRHIPRLQSELPEEVEAPTRNIRQIDRGRPGPANAVRGHRELIVKMDVDVVMPLAAGKTGRGETVGDSFDRGNLDAPVVQIGPGSAFRGEHLLPDGIVYD